jgi:hypothetical protein
MVPAPESAARTIAASSSSFTAVTPSALGHRRQRSSHTDT